MPILFYDYGYSTNDMINDSLNHKYFMDGRDNRPKIYHIKGRNESYIIPKVSNNEITIGYNDNNISIYNYLKNSFRAVDNPNFLFLIISDNNDKNWISLIRGIIPHKNKKILLPEIFKKPYNNDIGFHLETMDIEEDHGDNYEEYLKEYVDNFYVLSQNGYLNKIVNFPVFIFHNDKVMANDNLICIYYGDIDNNLYNILKEKIKEYGELNEYDDINSPKYYYTLNLLKYGIEIYIDYILITELNIYEPYNNIIEGEYAKNDAHNNVNIDGNGKIEWSITGEYVNDIFYFDANFSDFPDGMGILFKQGMTWRSFCESEYNTIGFKIYKNDDKEYVGDENGKPIYDLDDNLCIATDLIDNTKQYYNVKIFPLHITTWKDENEDIHGSATTENKKLYDYYMTHCKLDPSGVYGETILNLNDNQNLYINNIKVTYLWQDQLAVARKFILWHPYDDSIDGFHVGGIYSDGKIYMEYDG